jgi:3-phosphoglycerate kinase
MKTIRDFNFAGKRVLVRCDFNVPLNSKGDILDDFKIVQTLPTINYLLESGAKIILMSHLDDPGGKMVPRLRLDKIQEKLMEYLDLSITKTPDCVGPEIEAWIKEMPVRDVLLLENLRFCPEEEKGDLDFTRSLASLGDIYLNDAFGTCHRPHASLLVAKLLPSGEGLLLEKEIKVLSALRDNPVKPLVVILGGQAKGIETKLELINKMAKIADFILLGNLVARELEKKSLKPKFPEKVIFPLDSANNGLDIGPKTLAMFKNKIAVAKTVFWSGPLGQIEKEEFSRGSKEIIEAIIESRAFSVAGGGDTVGFLNQLGLREKFSHVSTGGDTLLLFLAGATLPGIKVLE